jgi:hypothetical protein
MLLTRKELIEALLNRKLLIGVAVVIGVCVVLWLVRG